MKISSILKTVDISDIWKIPYVVEGPEQKWGNEIGILQLLMNGSGQQ